MRRGGGGGSGVTFASFRGSSTATAYTPLETRWRPVDGIPDNFPRTKGIHKSQKMEFDAKFGFIGLFFD